MNVQRDYNPIMFEILGCPPERISKARLSKILGRWIRDNGYEMGGKILLNPQISDLTGLPPTETIGLGAILL